MQAKERWYGPGEMAKKLGVSVKALRVYEREGLVAPLRAESGWRAYGPAQVEQLHRIIALRDLGLTLKQIKVLLSGGQASFDTVLAMQQEALEAQKVRIERGLSLLKTARRKLSQGEALTVDDLIHLTQETTMSKFMAVQTLNNKYNALLEVRGLDALQDDITNRAREHFAGMGKTSEQIAAVYYELFLEAKQLMDIGDDASEAAKAFYRRWRGGIGDFKPPADVPMDRLEALRTAFREAMADPEITNSLPFDPAIFPFVARIGKGMKERGELE